jgi:hypothetical protein
MTPKFILQPFLDWPQKHPARAGAIAGWIQQAASVGSDIFLIPILTASLPRAEAGVWFVFHSLVGMIAMINLGFAIACQVAFTHGGGGGGNAFGGDFLHLSKGWPGVAQLLSLTRLLYVALAIVAALLALGLFEVLANFGQLSPVITSDV